MKYISRVFIMWLLELIVKRRVIGQHFVTASFQTSLEFSSAPVKNVWLEFLHEIPPSKEFTICHWINIKFFNNGHAACLWSYCTVKKQHDSMKCLQLCLYEMQDTANRDLQLKAWIPSRKEGLKDLGMVTTLYSYQHRTWTHLCWTLSTITGSSKFYRNGVPLLSSKTINATDIDLAMKSSSEMYDASFIFGQEPDSIGGDFDRYQAFIGYLTEFNVWNYTLTKTEIHSMAICSSFRKGNIVSWELADSDNSDKFGVHNVAMERFSHLDTLCKIDPRFVIFPQRVQYPEAKEICKIHGGSLAVPHSERENQLMMDIVKQHKNSCIANEGAAMEKLAWIGAELVDGVWHKVSHDSHEQSITSSPSRLNFTNFLGLSSHLSYDCVYLRKDGLWQDGTHNLCSFYLSLCTVCVIYRQPVFTVKGTCQQSLIDWNYYPIIDLQNQIKQYEGYKKNSIIFFDEGPQKWKMAPGPADTQKNIFVEWSTNTFTGGYPIGRKKVMINDLQCGMNSTAHLISISLCNVPRDFTCDSGNCVDMNKRCDGIKDCADESDEYLCPVVNIPNLYNNANAPDPKNKDTPLEQQLDPRIIKIDSIDTKNMVVALTMELFFAWHDSRLLFFNPIVNRHNVIPDHQAKQLLSLIHI